jgi:hypothetical protein
MMLSQSDRGAESYYLKATGIDTYKVCSAKPKRCKQVALTVDLELDSFASSKKLSSE